MINVSTAVRTVAQEDSDPTVSMTSTLMSTDAHPGASVEVLSNFSGRWVPGFTIVEAGEQGCRLRRRSDSAVLPVWFGLDEVRVVDR